MARWSRGRALPSGGAVSRRFVAVTASPVVVVAVALAVSMGTSAEGSAASGQPARYPAPAPNGSVFATLTCGSGVPLARRMFEYAETSTGAATPAGAAADPAFWSRWPVRVDTRNLRPGTVTPTFAEFASVDPSGQANLVVHVAPWMPHGRMRGWLVQSLTACNDVLGVAR